MIKRLLIVLGVCLFISKALAEPYTELTAPTSFLFRDQANWTALERDIRNAPTQVVIIDWEGMGGHVSMGDDFIDFLHRTNKTVIINVIGPSESMHALVICAAKNIRFNNGFLMFHLMANAYTGQVYKDKYSQEDNYEHMYGCIEKGIVTNEDVKKINQDQVLYVYPDGSKQFRKDLRP